MCVGECNIRTKIHSYVKTRSGKIHGIATLTNEAKTFIDVHKRTFKKNIKLVIIVSKRTHICTKK